jgi:hypothetical protein
MIFAVLDFADFAIILLIFVLFSAGGAAASIYFRRTDRERLARAEHKLDLILTHLGLDYRLPPETKWEEIAGDAAHKTSAIKAYREQHDVDLAEARRAVEDYMERALRRTLKP